MLTDVPLEEAVVGQAILSPSNTGAILDILRPTDLSSPILAAVLESVEVLHRAGEKWDARIIHRMAQERAGLAIDPAAIVLCTGSATFAWKSGAMRLVELRARRELLGIAGRLEGIASDPRHHPAEVIDIVTAELASVETAAEDFPPALLNSAAVAAEDIESAPWVIPGMLRRQHRAVIVGFEGDGKSTLLAQVGWAASQGIHPFTRSLHDPQRVVHVDLENPRDRIGLGYRPIIAACKKVRSFDDSRHYTLHRDDGMDLRSRRDRSQLEKVLHHIRPDLLCIGPLRKTYRRGQKESEEDRALEVQSILDDLRSRFDCALLMEHHAPHADGMQKRNPRPMGSSTWLGWPEFGLGMDPEMDERNRPIPGMFGLTRWRADRVKASWPRTINRGSVWPFDSPDLSEQRSGDGY